MEGCQDVYESAGLGVCFGAVTHDHDGLLVSIGVVGAFMETPELAALHHKCGRKEEVAA